MTTKAASERTKERKEKEYEENACIAEWFELGMTASSIVLIQHKRKLDLQPCHHSWMRNDVRGGVILHYRPHPSPPTAKSTISPLGGSTISYLPYQTTSQTG